MTDAIATSQIIATTVLVLAPLLWLASHLWGLSQLQKRLAENRQKLIDALKERHELCEKLVSKYGADSSVNKERVTALSAARATADKALSESGDQLVVAEVSLTEAMGKLLQSLQDTFGDGDDGGFVELRNKTMDVEDKVIEARDEYNALVARYNGQQTVMPAKLFAATLGHKPEMELEFEDVFLRFPLKIKATMPSRDSEFLRDFGVIGKDESK